MYVTNIAPIVDIPCDGVLIVRLFPVRSDEYNGDKSIALENIRLLSICLLF